jgi:c-di-GMP-binding flagellar brake protein YcgR
MLGRIRRKSVRWWIRQGAKLELEAGGRQSPCQVRDISYKGLQLVTALKLDKDKVISLRLTISDLLVLAAEVWVVWHKTAANQNIYGLYFTRIRDADKEAIYHFIYKHFPEQLTRRWWQEFREVQEKEKGESEMEDRRIFARFPVKVPVKFLKQQEAEEGQAQAYDFSARGIGLVTEQQLLPKTALELWVELQDQAQPLYLRGEVVWSVPAGENAYRAGVNLEKAELMSLSRILRAN